MTHDTEEMTQCEGPTPFEQRMYPVLQKLNAPVELLQIVGSYKDTMEDMEVVAMLDNWLSGMPNFLSVN